MINTPSDFDFNVINRGIYGTPVIIRNTIPKYNFGLTSLFGGPSKSTAQSFLVYNSDEEDVIIPGEGRRWADPNRRDYSPDFMENKILSLYFADEIPFNLQKAENRVPPETDLAHPWTVRERLIWLAADARDKWLLGLNQTLEKTVWSLAFTGKFQPKGEEEQVFPLENTLLALDGSAFYSDILGTLQSACDAVRKHGGNPTRIILNPVDWSTLIGTDEFQRLCDIRHYSTFVVDTPRMLSEGAYAVGTVSVPGYGNLEVVTYTGDYAEGSSRTYYLPRGKAILCDGNIGFVGHCGVRVKEGNTTNLVGLDHRTILYTVDRGDYSDTVLQAQSAPCPMLTAFNRYGVITGIPATAV